MKPRDAHHLFDDLLPAAMIKSPARASELNAIYLFKIVEEGEWTVTCVGPVPTVARGDDGKAQCTLQLSGDDMKSVIADPNLAMQLYFQGRLRVTGDPMLAMQLNALFALVA
jgi:hypothetical protein